MTVPEAADRGVSALLRSISQYPISAMNLAVIVVGGAWMYFSTTTAISSVRDELGRAKAQIVSLEVDNRKAADLAETRYEGLRNDLAKLQGSILAIQTDVSWLARGSRAAPDRQP